MNPDTFSRTQLFAMYITNRLNAITKPTIFITLLLSLFFTSLNLHAKTHPNVQVHSSIIDINKDTLQAKIDAVNNRKGLDEDLKSKLLSIYQSAQDNLSNIESYKSRSLEFNQSIKQSTDLLKNYQNEINDTVANLSKQKLEDFTKVSTTDLEQREIIEKGKVSALDEQYKKIENELSLQQSRPVQIREEILSAKQDLEATQTQIQQATNKNTNKIEIEANLILLKTLVDARTTETKMLDIEAISNPARVEILKAQLQLTELQKNGLLPIINTIESILIDRREKDAQNMQNELNEAEKELAGKHLLIQNLTRENIQLSRALQAVNLKIENYTDQKYKADEATKQINTEFKGADKKISLAAISPELGKILREQRRNLDANAQAYLQLETIQNETALASLEQYKSEDKLKKISDIDSYLKVLMDTQVDKSIASIDRFMIQSEIRVLLDNQKELLNKLTLDYSTYLRILGDYDFSEQQLITEANKFTKYLDENLLWVKSSDPFSIETLANLYYAIKWLLSPINGLHVITDLGHLFKEKTLLFILGILLIVGLKYSRNWALQQLATNNANHSKKYTTHFSFTLQALFYNFLRVANLPLIFAYYGWLINVDLHLNDFTRAIGIGFKNAAVPYLFINYFYELFTINGIINKHFGWKKINCQKIQKELHWVRYVAIISSFLITATAASNNTLYGDNLGRLAFIASMIGIALFWGRLLHPKTGLFNSALKLQKFILLNKLSFVWYSIIYIVPLIMIGFAIAGYYLSALQLQGQLIQSMRLIFCAIIIHQLVERWLTIIKHQLMLKNAEEQRKAALNNDRTTSAASENPILPNLASIIDIPKINAQTIRLLNVFIGLSLVVSFWIIWKNLLPAFSFLENIVLWQHLTIKDEQKLYEAVTLSNLLMASVYLSIAVVSVRNLSGVMEILVFRRLAIEAGTRYAFNQLANYTIITISFISIANELGGSWSQVQWLVAALSVGLGFGLQEIFANLVSGIILLFERPIRVSDTVTIGSITGKVSRIQMRATTLIDWDQKEHVVPNKTFITSQLVNWTLSDTITRLELLINVAYGTDLELAHQVMFNCVLDMPEILKEPAPCVLIVGFGESAVNFSIRIFVDEMANRLPVTHFLYIRIEKALREHNIQMPYPQQDIHIKSLPA